MEPVLLTLLLVQCWVACGTARLEVPEDIHARSVHSDTPSDSGSTVRFGVPAVMGAVSPSPDAPSDGDVLLRIASLWRNFPDGWALSNPCNEWDYVFCDDSSRAITALILDGNDDPIFKNNRYCSLSSEIGNLRSLQLLYIRNMGLSGNLPSTIWRLTNLTHLSLPDNSFGGTLPQSLGNLQQLRILSFEKNRFSGPLPSSLWSLTKLEWLILGSNSFSGMLPCAVSKVVPLNYLDLSSNQLSGPLPSALAKLKSLHNLLASKNLFSGSLPSFLGNLTKLAWLDLSFNQFVGTIPAVLSSLPDLLSMHINNNYLTGPPTIPGTSQMVWMWDISFNFLTGVCPPETVSKQVYVIKNCIPSCDGQKSPSACNLFCGADSPSGVCGGKGTCMLQDSAQCVCQPGAKRSCNLMKTPCTCV